MGCRVAETGGITEMDAQPNIVLVHGAWADGSCWSAVIARLQADGWALPGCQRTTSCIISRRTSTR
jgi:hypothetical protein